MNFHINNIIYTYLYIQIYLSYIFIKLKILHVLFIYKIFAFIYFSDKPHQEAT